MGAHCTVVPIPFIGITEQGLALVLHNIIQSLRLGSTRHVLTSQDKTNERTGNAGHGQGVPIPPSAVMELLNKHILY